MPYRQDVSLHCDLMGSCNFRGATRDSYAFDYWCRRCDVERPKGGIDGSQVGRAYRDGRSEGLRDDSLSLCTTAALPWLPQTNS